MKTRKLVSEYSTLAIGGAVVGNIAAMPGVPAGISNNAMSGFQLASVGPTIGVAGGLMKQVEGMGKKRKGVMF